MSGAVAMTGRVVDRASGLVATPWAAIVGIILLLDRIFAVFLGTSAPTDAALYRQGGVPARRSRSLESDTADAQYVALATPNPEPVLVGAEFVEGEGNRVMRPAGHKPPQLAHATVQRSDGVYVGLNEAWEQGRGLAAVRVQHRER
jgi:hypothetical protein